MPIPKHTISRATGCADLPRRASSDWASSGSSCCICTTPICTWTLRQGAEKGGAVDALVALKEQGIAESIGIATGNLQALTDYLNTDVFDVLLSHNKYTLLDRSAEPLMDACVHKGVAFLNAAPYGGGLLARGPGATTKYAYAEADEGLLKRAAELEALCAQARDTPRSGRTPVLDAGQQGRFNGVRDVEPYQAGADDRARRTAHLGRVLAGRRKADGVLALAIRQKTNR